MWSHDPALLNSTAIEYSTVINNSVVKLQAKPTTIMPKVEAEHIELESVAHRFIKQCYRSIK